MSTAWEKLISKLVESITNPIQIFGIITVGGFILFYFVLVSDLPITHKTVFLGFLALLLLVIVISFVYVVIKKPWNFFRRIEAKMDEFDQTTKFVSSEGLIDFIRKTVREISQKDRKNG